MGTGRGILLSDPETHNVAVGCNVTSPCESDGASLCPRDRSMCVSSWNTSSCLCYPGMGQIVLRLFHKCSKMFEHQIK